MNTWGNEQYDMPNMMAMPGMMPNMLPPGSLAPPLVPPFSVMGEINQMHVQQMGTPLVNPPQPTGHFIGPVIPENQVNEVVTIPDIQEQVKEQSQMINESKSDRRQGRDKNHNDRRDRERERERGRRRSRSRNREQHNKDRGARGEHRNRSDHRERQSKWDNNEKVNQQLLNMQQPNNMMMPGGQIMQYGNMMQPNMQNTMMNQQMEMSNMQHMLPGMSMMPNMMMMNQQMQMSNQYIYFSNGVILPALPGTTTPQRRERPPGCRTIFVGGLPPGITDDVVTEIFQRFGGVSEVKLHKQGVCHVRFEKPEFVEQSFFVSGSRLKFHDQMESEATTLFVDYALNRDDQNEHEKNKRKRTPTPPRVEQFNATALVTIGEKIKSDNEFAEAAPTLAAWLERGECNKKNSNAFYSLIQASNNQLRRLFNEKMQIDDEYQTLRNSIRDKFGHIILQFEQVAKILTAAKLQRVSDHFSKQQRRNIEMWLKMAEELDNIRDEFNAIFDEEEMEKGGKNNMVSLEKYEQLRLENENLSYELEGYKNEAHLAKDDAERKFEKFKAHFIAQQALQNKQVYPSLPPPPMPNIPMDSHMNAKPQPPPPLPDDVTSSGAAVTASEAKLISLLSAFLMVHPLGATLDYLVSYVKSLAPNVTQSVVLDVLKKYNDVFRRKTTGIGACIEHKWGFVIFDAIKME